jgi:dTDP-4-dehydrorhamnose reductase
VSPSYVEDVVDATLALLSLEPAGGLYHCVNSGSTTWHGLAEVVAHLLGARAGLQAVAMADVPMQAPRPQYCALSNARLRAIGVEMPTWQDALARHVRM